MKKLISIVFLFIMMGNTVYSQGIKKCVSLDENLFISYKIKQNDNIWNIAQKYKLNPDSIILFNELNDKKFSKNKRIRKREDGEFYFLIKKDEFIFLPNKSPDFQLLNYKNDSVLNKIKNDLKKTQDSLKETQNKNKLLSYVIYFLLLPLCLGLLAVLIVKIIQHKKERDTEN